MNLTTAEKLAKELISKHLTSEWGFKWNRRVRAFGLCNFSKREIQLSKILTEAGEEDQIRDTILHEIAHAIAGFDAGHGPVWKAHARRIGCSAERTGTASDAQNAARKPSYVLMHSETGEVVKEFFRKPGKKLMNNVNTFYVRGRKSETMGKLVVKKVK